MPDMCTTDPHRFATTAPTARGRNRRFGRRDRARCGLLATIVIIAAACVSAEAVLREPRRLVIHSGERLAPARERMEEIDDRVREQHDSIREDLSFMINHGAQEGPAYPWETLEINETGDTAYIHYQDRTGLAGPYLLYAHLHLMVAQDRLGRWLPEADGATTYEIEKAILSVMSDAWMLLRSVYDARPYDLLEELMYSRENDYLDAYILTARPDAFVEARRTWMAENPEQRDAFIAWFRKAFERDPPGVRGGTGER
ncbi:MAG: hypothetical protein OXL34_01400 [Gemmatimonadota bacterium]|nr:hypothetical protein [Gemmatimonadota bacterium]